MDFIKNQGEKLDGTLCFDNFFESLAGLGKEKSLKIVKAFSLSA